MTRIRLHSKLQNPALVLTIAGLFASQIKGLRADTATWTNAVTGNWNDPTQWTPTVVPNNDTPPGTTYDAFLNGTGSAYTVTVNAPTTVDNLYVGPGALLNDSLNTVSTGMLTVNDTLTLDNSTLQVTTLTPIGGTLQRTNATVVFNGTLSNFSSPVDLATISPYYGMVALGSGSSMSTLTLMNSAGPISVVNFAPPVLHILPTPSRFQNVTLESDLTIQTNATAWVISNLTLDNVTIRIKEGARLEITNPSSPHDPPDTVLGGSGTVYFDGTPAAFNEQSDHDNFYAGPFLETIAAGISIRTLSGSGYIEGGLAIQGTISAETPGTDIFFTGGVANAGTLQAINGATFNRLAVSGVPLISNSGLIKVGTGSSASFGAAGTTFINTGTILCDGGTMTFSGGQNGGFYNFGGTIQATNGGVLNFLFGNFTLSSPLSLSSGSTAKFLFFTGTNTIPFATIASIIGSGDIALGSRSLTSDSIQANSLTINGAYTIRPNNPFSKINVLTLSHTDSGSNATYTSSLQLNNNRLILQSTDPADKTNKILALNEAIFAGHNGTTNVWSSTQGITSAAVAADPQHLTLGVFDNKALARTDFAGGTNNIDANSLIVSPALIGDANLDGIVNFNDMLAVTGNWNTQGLVNGISTIDFAHGDLNGDGIVNFNDMLVVTGHWNNTSSTFNMAAAVAEAFSVEGVDAADSGGAALGVAAVPEPGTVAVLFAGAMLLMRRRKLGREGGGASVLSHPGLG